MLEKSAAADDIGGLFQSILVLLERMRVFFCIDGVIRLFVVIPLIWVFVGDNGMFGMIVLEMFVFDDANLGDLGIRIIHLADSLKVIGSFLVDEFKGSIF